jgi:lipopolysaccharide transport system ATP-binding protein
MSSEIFQPSDARYSVSAEGLGKRYRIGIRRGAGALYDRLGSIVSKRGSGYEPTEALQADQSILWALRDVTFKVPTGTVMGIIGRNGSGKTTLLKILARVTAPTEGTAMVRGRVGALLQVGAGFHPELSGRDNIGLSGAVLGMSREEIDSLRDRIVDFAEIGRFIDTPVKHYSSGMFMRLAFSVSAHLPAEVMLVDEVLGVGDALFARKCLLRIRELVRDGRTVVFVSHSLDSIHELCTSAVVLEQGRLVFEGGPDESVRFYKREIVRGKFQPQAAAPDPLPAGTKA